MFALIVVFQSEIRHVLSDVGRRVSFLRGSAVEGDSYDDIVLAANLFSQHQTGALIVIEREIGLRTYIESGVAMDARLSYDLLATIFRPSAPLHDGAVIIQKDRLAAAACFLPLSMNPVLSTQMGTRHRAGIGITEETDAIAVIVSEETGAISVAVGGKIERDLTVEHLREGLSMELRRYMSPVALPTVGPQNDESDGAQGVAAAGGRADGRRWRRGCGDGAAAMMSFLRRWVLHNFWLKVLSLVLATGLWLAISPDQEPAEVTLRVPIEFRHVPPATGDQPRLRTRRRRFE